MSRTSKAARAAFRVRHRGQLLEESKAYYIAHKDERAAYQKTRRQTKREIVSFQDWKHGLKKRYGMTPEKYENILSAQNGCCAICGTDSPGGRGKFHTDHCHETSRIRGLLCNKCNLGLGYFMDSVGVLLKAVTYLTKP